MTTTKSAKMRPDIPQKTNPGAQLRFGGLHSALKSIDALGEKNLGEIGGINRLMVFDTFLVVIFVLNNALKFADPHQDLAMFKKKKKRDFALVAGH